MLLNHGISDSEILPAGFSIFHKDRRSRGSGILVAIKETISARRLPSLESLELLSILVDIKDTVIPNTVNIADSANPDISSLC